MDLNLQHWVFKTFVNQQGIDQVVEYFNTLLATVERLNAVEPNPTNSQGHIIDGMGQQFLSSLLPYFRAAQNQVVVSSRSESIEISAQYSYHPCMAYAILIQLLKSLKAEWSIVVTSRFGDVDWYTSEQPTDKDNLVVTLQVDNYTYTFNPGIEQSILSDVICSIRERIQYRLL